MFKNFFTNKRETKKPSTSKTEKHSEEKKHTFLKNILVVASGKGGVGKSTTAVNLAYTLSERGSKVGILDADIYGPSLPLLLHKTEPIIHSKQTDEKEKIIPPSYAGIKVMSIGFFHEQAKAAVMRGPMVTSLIKQLFNRVNWGFLDYLIIDYPPGTGDIQLTLSQIAQITGAILVTTPQELSLIDVRKAINMFQLTNIPILGVIENMGSFICENCHYKHHIFPEGGGNKIAKEYKVPILAKIPLEKKIALSSDKGLSMIKTYPNSETVQEYLRCADNIIKRLNQSKDRGNSLNNFSLTWQKT